MDEPEAISVDAAGDVYIAGYCNPPNDSPPGVFCVAKLDAAGKTLWLRSYGVGATYGNYGVSMAADAAGNVFVAGELFGSGDFGGVPLSSPGTGNGAFLLSLDGGGSVRWSHAFGSTDQVWSGPEGDAPGGYVGTDTMPTSLAVAAQGQVVITGTIGGKTDFGTGALDPALGEDFVASFGAADGTAQWSRQLQAGSWIVAVPQIAPAPGGSVVAADQLYLLDATGAVTWQKSLSVPDLVQDMRTDPAGNIVLAGSFDAQNDGAYSTYVVSLTPDGAAHWNATIAGSDFVANPRIAVDASGSAVIGTVCDGGASVGGLSIATKGGEDICLVRFDPNGSPVDIASFGTPAQDGLGDTAITLGGRALVVGTSVGDTADVGYQAFVSL